MTNMVKLIVAASLALAASAVSAHANCQIRGGASFNDPGPWPLYLVVNSGQACRQPFFTGGNVTLKKLSISSDPRNGKVELVRGGFYVYTSQPGFRGADRFGLVICGVTAQGKEACTNLAINVTVH